MTEIIRDELEVHVAAVIKSNLIADNLSVVRIEKITSELTQDIMDLIDEFQGIYGRLCEECEKELDHQEDEETAEEFTRYVD